MLTTSRWTNQNDWVVNMFNRFTLDSSRTCKNHSYCNLSRTLPVDFLHRCVLLLKLMIWVISTADWWLIDWLIDRQSSSWQQEQCQPRSSFLSPTDTEPRTTLTPAHLCPSSQVTSPVCRGVADVVWVYDRCMTGVFATADTPGVLIFYSLDGSRPAAAQRGPAGSSRKYSEPVLLPAGRVSVRAVAVTR